MKSIKTKQTPPPSFYFELPITNISITNLESLFLKRIKVLRMVQDSVKKDKLFNLEEDVLSHFVTRLVCSQIDWVYKWFVEAETNYFIRQGGEYSTLLSMYSGLRVEENKVYIERESCIKGDSCINNSVSSINTNIVYAHFTKLSTAFANREVCVREGYCRVTNHLQILISNEFRINLLKKKCTKGDSRLLRLCTTTFNTPISSTKCLYKEEDKLYYPPCITFILEYLEKNKHLKYNDRQSLSLFLKDCGLSLEDSVTFFSSRFGVSKEEFNKHYLYNIRHNYGLEGKKANYNCYSCQKMAYNRNSIGLSGCPFVDNKGYVKEYSTKRGVDLEDSVGCTGLLERLTKEKYEKGVTTPFKYFVTYKGICRGE